MTRQLSNPKSVQAQLDELREAQEKVKVLTDELKTYLEENDLDELQGISTKYVRTWVNDSLAFNSKQFKLDHSELYAAYKTLEKAGYYKHEVKAIK